MVYIVRVGKFYVSDVEAIVINNIKGVILSINDIKVFGDKDFANNIAKLTGGKVIKVDEEDIN